MVNVHPMRIPGRWREGFALDYHTIRSVYLGDDELGHPQFDTQRSELGQLLYDLKYANDQRAIGPLVEALADFFAGWRPGVDVIIPVPASRPRAAQPLLSLANEFSRRLGVPCSAMAVTKVRDVPELKNVYAYDERTRLLAGAHSVDAGQVHGRKALLLDDLYRSGATLNAIAQVLYDAGAAEVFAMTVTRTRSNR